MKMWRELLPSDRVIPAAAMRKLEMQAAADGITLEQLMEAAGYAVFSYVRDCYPPAEHPCVTVLCGNGNNGGDGFVIARLLKTAGYQVCTLLVNGAPRSDGLAAEKMQEWQAVADEDTCVLMPTEERAFEMFWQRRFTDAAALVVDAVYGIGFHGALPTPISRLFSRLNALSATVIAVDLPSGLQADCHRADRNTLAATATVTFTAPKPSVVMTATDGLCGRKIVASVGIPEDMARPYEQVFEEIGRNTVERLILPREPFSHKGMFGQLLAVCGSYGMAGAAMLAGKAALRCGIGLLHMAIPSDIYPIVAGQLWEAVFHSMAVPDAQALSGWTTMCDAVLVGCGLSRDPAVWHMLREWLPTVKKTLILDADGLNFLSTHKDIRKDLSAPLILTPHPKEAARLLGVSVADVERDRISAVKRLAAVYGAVAVLKGQGTLVAAPDSDTVYINTTGCSGMATGGSGDVLAGMIAAFVAGGMNPFQAATAGVYLHGLAGNVTAAELGNTAMLPSDLIERLPNVLSSFER